MERPAWFIASLLGLIAILMLAHLAMLFVGVRACADYAAVLIERAAQDPAYIVVDSDPECANVEETFSDAVGQYLAVILSLLGGAAISGSVAMRAKKEDEDAGER